MNSLYVQVMGITYGSVMVPQDVKPDEAEAIAKTSKHIARILQDATVKKVIVTDKLVNFVIEENDHE